jgi:hypothetical protein
MRAEGATYAAIGRALGRLPSVVRPHLDQIAAEKIKQKNSTYYNLNSEKERERSRHWRNANPDKRQNATHRWRKANPDKVREQRRRSYYKNPKKAIERARLWNRANPEKIRDINRICGRRRYAWKRAARRRALLLLTKSAIADRFDLWANRCAFCGVNAKHPRNKGYKLLTHEHIMALTKGGIDEADNIAPACFTCNCSKHNRPVETWYRKQPFFTEARWRKICRHCPGAVIGQLPLAMPPSDTEAA